jgi:hypothetical protein
MIDLSRKIRIGYSPRENLMFFIFFYSLERREGKEKGNIKAILETPK